MAQVWQLFGAKQVKHMLGHATQLPLKAYNPFGQLSIQKLLN